MFSCLPARTTSVAGTVSGTQKNFSDFVQKHFVSATNVSQFAKPKKHGQQCVLVYQGLNCPGDLNGVNSHGKN